MISEKDIIDVVCDVLSGDKNTPKSQSSGHKSGFYVREPWIKSYSSLKSAKKLITEHEVRAAVKNGSKILKIPKDAIIGPLALEIIQEKGINIIRE